MRATETIYREMLTGLRQAAGGQLQEDCDLSVRLWAAAAQIQALEAQAEWVLGQSFPQTAAGVYLTATEPCEASFGRPPAGRPVS